MMRFAPLLAVVAAALALSGAALAQQGPEFKLGFKALADMIPDRVGIPVEDEHYGPNGDSLQQTTTGLMVWRKADNWTAFTNGHRTWVNGPNGVQERGNDERFDWEAPLPDAATTPTAAPPADPTATPVPSATPTATPLPKPTLRGSEPNVIQGLNLRQDSVLVLGEVRNEGSTPAYNVKVTARLVSASGEAAGTANQVIPYLGPGDAVGYQVDVRNPLPYVRAEVDLDASPTYFATFERLDVAYGKNEKIANKDGDISYHFEGTVTNSSGKPLSLNAIHVWFLDEQNRVVWMETAYFPGALAPGDSTVFQVKTAWDRDNPRIAAINQIRYYATGQVR